ncbi:hypothetical protein BJ878DRAFT_157723 [Calycina marina]|uniref:Uncharacterized protein n=1 Tax=Calycina marina TaxID=1763456 RepID=A0A9P7Z085_9HELO|nr:hypothetical protein BJ878DRAFT_157723 [Calycina marina]
MFPTFAVITHGRSTIPSVMHGQRTLCGKLYALSTSTIGFHPDYHIRGEPDSGNNTLSTIIQAACALVLSRKGNSDFITFRKTGAGRHFAVDGIENMVTPALTSFPVQIVLPDTQTTALRSFLQAVQTQHPAKTQHENLGIKDSACSIPNGEELSNFSPPYLIVQAANVSHEKLPGLTPVDVPWNGSQTPFSICCIIKDHGIKVNTSFNTNVISVDDVKSLVDNLGRLLADIVAALYRGGEDLLADVLGETR